MHLFVSDLDGTLLQDDGALSATARDGLNELLDAGLAFTVATARSAISVARLLEGVHIQLPVVALNGGCITDLASGDHHHFEVIPAPVARAIIERALSLDLQPVLATHAAGEDHLFFPAPGPDNDGVRWHLEQRQAERDPRLRPPCETEEALAEEITVVALIAARERLVGLRDWIAERFAGRVRLQFFENNYNLGWYWLTVHPEAATKAHALKRLCRSLDVTLDDVTVFGDAFNDLSMFRVAGRAVAVANADPALKAHAHEVIGPNGDDAVVRYLRGAWADRGSSA